MTSGKASYVTTKINGKLEGVFMSSMEQVQITISLEYTEIPLFNIQSFQGTQFVPVRCGVVSCLGEGFKDGYTKWALNDKVRVDIKGPMNTEVGFVVRYC